MKIQKTKQIDIKATKQEIYTKILKTAETHFKTRCENFDRDFEKYPINPNKPLIFKVSGLRQEVLYHKENYWACDVISWFYETDCRIKEFLIFTFNCDIVDDEISISLSVEGKFGSFTNDNPETYNNMEPDFSYFFQKYTDNFMNKKIYPLFQ